jgi:murein DD-endopeptidase MepM/ murein hydrolase activator NlpD
MATSIEIEPRAPHTTAAVVVAQRASRSRTVRPAKRVRRHVVRWVAPNGGPVVSPFGMRWGRLHKGLDFGAGYGSPIAAAGDGVVVGSGYLSGESGYGLITIIRHSNGYYTAYAHQSRSFVHSGERVNAGETIGLVGSTGHSTGPHLHFEVRTYEGGGQINPRPWLREHGVYV